MAFRFLKKMFSRKNKGHIVLTPEEAYAPLPPEEVEVFKPEALTAPVSDPDSVTEEPQVKESQAEEPQPAFESVETPAEEAETPEKPEETIEVQETQPPYEIWLYGCLDDAITAKSAIRTCIISAYRGLQEDSAGFTARMASGAKVQIEVRSDSAYVSEQAAYLKTLYKDVFLTDRDVQNAVMMQIDLFNAFAHFKLMPPYESADLDAFTGSIYDIAEPIRAFILNQKAELHRWDKKLVISADGQTDFTVFMPIRRRSAQVSHTETEFADEARRKRSIDQLAKRGIEGISSAPVQVHEADARLRSPEEIINRLTAIFACSLKAQAFSSPREVSAPDVWSANAIKRLDAQYSVNRNFTAKEAEYAKKLLPSQHAMQLLRFESCQVLLWALGLAKLSWPAERCDLSFIMRIIRDADTEVLLRIAKPRPLNNILDMHDITYRLHSLCVLGDDKQLEAATVDHDVVYERHYALNWLVSADGITDWDFVVPKI